ncbi:MAG: hypothetical protein J1E34_08135 [Oscillospiraceae bacterium]|nr:hypothetical protein [Oscillospiraceae bacterium]
MSYLKILEILTCDEPSAYEVSFDMLPLGQGGKTVYQRFFSLFAGINIFPKILKMIAYAFYELVGEKREKMNFALNERRAIIAAEEQGGCKPDEIVEALSEKNK